VFSFLKIVAVRDKGAGN